MTVWPSGGKTIPRVTAEFGPRDPIHTPNGATTGSFHYGIDLIGWANNKSPCAGTVIFARYNGGGGNQINIRADNGDVFHILHNARFLVSEGQRVAEGQDVGVMGTTGNSTGVHCHFETHPGGGAAVNPRGYMAAAIGSSTAGNGGTIIIPKRKVNPVLSITRIVRKGVGEFIMYASATTVSLSVELSANPEKGRRDFELGVAKALAVAVGLEADIPVLDDSPNGQWYLRNQLAAAAAGMPADFPLAPGNPWRSGSAALDPAALKAAVNEAIAGLELGEVSGNTLPEIAIAVADELARRAQA